MDTTRRLMTEAISSSRTPKVVAAAVLTGSLLAGADNVQSVSLTAATLAVAEVARSRFGVKSLRRNATGPASPSPGPVAGQTP
jgi:hypothetical protein